MKKAFAQVTIPSSASVLPEWKLTNTGAVISAFLRYSAVLGGLALLAYLIMGGFQLLTSAGDSGKVKGGTDKITFAIVGFIIIFSAYWILQIVEYVFNLSIL